MAFSSIVVVCVLPLLKVNMKENFNIYYLILTVYKILEAPCPFLVDPVRNLITLLMNLMTYLFSQMMIVMMLVIRSP